MEIKKSEKKMTNVIYDVFDVKGNYLCLLDYGGSTDYQALHIEDNIEGYIIWKKLEDYIETDPETEEDEEDIEENKEKTKEQINYRILRKELGLSREDVEDNIEDINMCFYEFTTEEDRKQAEQLFFHVNDVDHDRCKHRNIVLYDNSELYKIAQKIIKIKKKLNLN